jgi:hypothetical protein
LVYIYLLDALPVSPPVRQSPPCTPLMRAEPAEGAGKGSCPSRTVHPGTPSTPPRPSSCPPLHQASGGGTTMGRTTTKQAPEQLSCPFQMPARGWSSRRNPLHCSCWPKRRSPWWSVRKPCRTQRQVFGAGRFDQTQGYLPRSVQRPARCQTHRPRLSVALALDQTHSSLLLHHPPLVVSVQTH